MCKIPGELLVRLAGGGRSEEDHGHGGVQAEGRHDHVARVAPRNHVVDLGDHP